MSSGSGCGDSDAVEGPVGLLAAAADELVALAETEPLDGDGLGEVLVAAEVQCRRVDAALARLAERFRVSMVWAESGARSPGAWLAHRCGTPRSEANGRFRLGRDLTRMPHVRAAFVAGDIAGCHVRRLAVLARNPRLADAFAEAEEQLVGWARELPWPQFCQALDYWRHAADPDGAERTAVDDHAARRVELHHGLRGTGLLEGELTATSREIVANALERIHDELFTTEWATARDQLDREPTIEDLPRSRTQRIHDALQEMAIRACTAPGDGKRPEPLLTVLVGLESLERTCELDTGTVVTPGQLAPLLDRALIERIVFDPPNRVIEVSTARTYRGALRRAIQARDRTCQHPGCHTPARWCEIDHIHPHATGGPTTFDNGQLLCNHHNQWKHHHPDNNREPPGHSPPREPPHAA